jgi:hypothetical protein
MTGDATSLLTPAQLPVAPATCQPVYPHQYLRVNTIFEVARAAGLRTAWSTSTSRTRSSTVPPATASRISSRPRSTAARPRPLHRRLDDRQRAHPAVRQLQGPGHPQRNQRLRPQRHDQGRYAGDLRDELQTVSTAEKLPIPDGFAGGYLADGVTPGPLLSRALDYINTQIEAMQNAIKHAGLQRSTVIVLSAKHGQSPQTPSALTRIPDGPIIAALNTAWTTAHPGSGKLVAFSIDDDGMLIWLNDRSAGAESFAKDFLLDHSGVGNDINSNPKP